MSVMKRGLFAGTPSGAIVISGAQAKRFRLDAKVLNASFAGKLHTFTVVDSPVMEPGLARKVAFRSYAATAVGEPGTTARLDYSPAIGFHATVRSSHGSWNVDAAYAGRTTTYVSHVGRLGSSAAEKEVGDQTA